jgi:phage tail sheath protein FI
LYKLQNNTSKKAALLTKFNSVRSSSYVTFGSSPLYTYNKYNDTYVWIPDNAHMCGLCANTDRVADAWFSPAGLNRGQLRGVIKLAYNPNQTDRDDLYKARINPIISLPGEGIILFGDKTALSKPSAFDRINVRRLFNVLKRTVSNATRYQLFEFNDEFTRAAFVNSVEPFLRDVQGRRGISDGRVVCDASNNTPEVIDTNRFVGQIFVKPNRAINFAELQFIATRTGVEFTEIAG